MAERSHVRKHRRHAAVAQATQADDQPGIRSRGSPARPDHTARLGSSSAKDRSPIWIMAPLKPFKISDSFQQPTSGRPCCMTRMRVVPSRAKARSISSPASAPTGSTHAKPCATKASTLACRWPHWRVCNSSRNIAQHRLGIHLQDLSVSAQQSSTNAQSVNPYAKARPRGAAKRGIAFRQKLTISDQNACARAKHLFGHLT